MNRSLTYFAVTGLTLLAGYIASRPAPSAQEPADAKTTEPLDVEAVVAAPIADVWRAWTTNEGVQEFFAPETNIELAIGGPYEFFFLPDAEPGSRGAENVHILSYVPMEMLSFEWDAPPHLPNARQHRTWVVLFFDPKGENETHVRLVHLGWGEMKVKHPEHAEEWDQARQYFARAWPHVLQSLQRRFTDGPKWDENGELRW